MEGNGEGMVAIVQGLRDAGLAVTLVRRRQIHGTVKQPKIVVHTKSTVDNSTSALPAASVDKAAQICDDRYTSSYQLAHCRARPSSPPVELAEFPPQRQEPCRTQGNFEIGGVGSSESPRHSFMHTSVSRSRLRNSFSSVDRGLLSNSRSSRATEAFAHSLRKYPSLSPYRSVSPNRSISTELVQRLLAYTQAKNFSKSSYHSKSMRSLRNKTESPKESPPKTKSTKSVQTYTRTRVKERTIPEGEGKENVKEQKKKKRAQYKDNHVNTMYDYLKSTSTRRFSRVSDVRYLNDITRCLRDTLRQICDEQPSALLSVTLADRVTDVPQHPRQIQPAQAGAPRTTHRTPKWESRKN
ncbi:hypothetical protein ABMA27_011117 [Loxostege sticticalis]|uniref:Uncharacterized protein n=1 Tax=Loxostege sticticalis TaxID=481309 RepID=A0ABR3H3C7_LOXSC